MPCLEVDQGVAASPVRWLTKSLPLCVDWYISQEGRNRIHAAHSSTDER